MREKESYEERLQRIKNESPRAYGSWSDKERAALKVIYLKARAEGNSPTEIIMELSRIFKRHPSAIRFRLRKFGFVKS